MISGRNFTFHGLQYETMNMMLHLEAIIKEFLGRKYTLKLWFILFEYNVKYLV